MHVGARPSAFPEELRSCNSILHPCRCLPRALVEAAVVARDTVVCCFENETAEWCLAVWRSWGARDFDVFYQSYEELGRLEACMRKRR